MFTAYSQFIKEGTLDVQLSTSVKKDGTFVSNNLLRCLVGFT